MKDPYEFIPLPPMAASVTQMLEDMQRVRNTAEEAVLMKPKKIENTNLPLLLLGKPKVISNGGFQPDCDHNHAFDSLGYMATTAKLTDVQNPKENPDKPMSIADALKALDEACSLYWYPEIKSVVYPGLNALEAVAYVADIIIESGRHNKHDTLLHPVVAGRIRQIVRNEIGKGKPPDPSIAAIFRLAHPVSNPPAPPASHPKLKPFERKFS